MIQIRCLKLVLNLRLSQPRRGKVKRTTAICMTRLCICTWVGQREILSWIPEKKTGTVVIKEGTTKIGYSSIRRTNVDKIVIPESVKSIDIYTFVSCKTPLVLELNWKTKEDVDEITTKMSSFSFNGTDRSAVKVTVPKGTKSYYESHWLWSNLGGIEERP